MTTLAEALRDPARRRALVSDGAAFVKAEVASKRGIRGTALKTGFRAFAAVRPGIVEQAVDRLMPHFAPVLDPFWLDARAQPDPVAALVARDGEIADALLEVTDQLADRARNRVIIRIYRGLRGQARGHVIAGIPGLARLARRHAA